MDLCATDRGRRARRGLSLAGALLVGVSSAALAASPVAAQAVVQADPAQPSATTPAAAAGGTRVEEVVVTSTRSGAQALQNVPMAVSVVNSVEADRSGLGNLADIAKFTPSLSITEIGPGLNKFDMRGLSTGAYITSDTSDRSLVAVYLDDTPISVQGQTPDLRIYDLDRVEILRGPQGTLFGASSMAGTVRFVTAKPSLRSSFGALEVTGAETEHGSGSYSLRGTFNTPLIADQLAVRGAIYQGEDGGYINNIGDRNKKDANLNRTTQARVAVRWTPTQNLTADFAATYEKSRASGLNTALSGLPSYTDSTNSAEGTRDSLQLYQLNLDYDLGPADLVSSTAYTWRRIGYNASSDPPIAYFFDGTGSGLPVSTTTFPLFYQPSTYNQQITNSIPSQHYEIDQKIHDVMQELRLVSKDKGPLKWTVGVFYEAQTRNLYQDTPTPGFDTLSYENFYYGPFNTPDGLYNSKTVDAAFNPNDIFSGLQNVSDSQVAIYTDDTWHVTHKLDLTAGVRYFDYHEKYYLFESGVYGVINHVPLILNTKQASNGFNPRFNASYHVDEDLMVYAEAAKGFRFGGANQPVPEGSSGIALQCQQNLAAYGYASAPLTFGPDHLWNYSVGEKARLANGRMTLNADYYYIDWQDVQTRLSLNCSYFFTENKGSVISQGVEAESTFRLTPEITLSGSFAYNSSRANGDIPTVGAFNGDQSPYAPNWTASAFVFYDRHLYEGMLHLQLSYHFRGEENTTYDPYATSFNVSTGALTKTGANQNFAIIPATQDVSAAITYEVGRYELGVYGNNLTDGVKVTNIAPATYFAIYQAGAQETVARPRTVGMRLKAKF